MYKFTQTFLAELEAFLINEKLLAWKNFSYLQRLVWFPLRFLGMGCSEKFKSIGTWVVITYSFMVLGTLILSNAGMARTDYSYFVAIGIFVIPLIIVVFSMPSIYGTSGVNVGAVVFVHHFLRGGGITSSKEVELLKKSVKPFEDKARSRVTALKWVVGLIWACFLYTFAKTIDTDRASSAIHPPDITVTVVMFLAVVVGYFVVWGYEASLDILFRAIEFGCNDFCFEIETSEKRAKELTDAIANFSVVVPSRQ